MKVPGSTNPSPPEEPPGRFSEPGKGESSDQPPPASKKAKFPGFVSPSDSLTIAAIYALIGALWIKFSDRWLFSRIEDPEFAKQLSTLKGWGFVFVTAILLALVLAHYLNRIRKSELRWWETEERYGLLAGNLRDYAILLLDPEGRITRCNEGAKVIMGQEESQLAGKYYSCLFIPEDIERGKPAAALKIALSQGRFEEETWRVRKEEERYWAETVLTPLFSPSGKLMGYAAIIRDISQRRDVERNLSRANRALRAISECGQAIMRAKSEEELLREVCRTIVTFAGYRLAWVGYAMEDENRTVRPVAQAGHEEGYLEKACITWADTERGRGPVGVSIRTGQHFVVQNIETEPFFEPWRKEAMRRGYAALISLPLMRENRAFGALAIYAGEPDAFDSEEVKLLNELAGDLTIGIMAIRGQVEQKKAQEQLEALSRRLVRVQEAERRHLARELHDEVGQALTALKIALQGLKRAGLTAEGLKEAETGLRSVDHLLNQVRQLSLDLRPPLLDELGLPAALRWLASQVSRRSRLRTEFHLDANFPRLDPDLETACFRIIQEALTNITRHASAKSVTVDVRRDADQVRLRIRDDGSGFDYAEAMKSAREGRSIGLLAMAERASLAGGQFECQSRPGGGTVIDASFPIRLPPE